MFDLVSCESVLVLIKYQLNSRLLVTVNIQRLLLNKWAEIGNKTRKPEGGPLTLCSQTTFHEMRS